MCSETCDDRPPHGTTESSLMRQVVRFCRWGFVNNYLEGGCLQWTYSHIKGSSVFIHKFVKLFSTTVTLNFYHYKSKLSSQDYVCTLMLYVCAGWLSWSMRLSGWPGWECRSLHQLRRYYNRRLASRATKTISIYVSRTLMMSLIPYRKHSRPSSRAMWIGPSRTSSLDSVLWHGTVWI